MIRLFEDTARPVYSDSTTGCDDGWLAYNNNCYMINTIKSVSRAAAAQECNNQDASLLRIESQDQLVSNPLMLISLHHYLFTLRLKLLSWLILQAIHVHFI